VSHQEIEEVYVDILSTLSITPCAKSSLKESSHLGWSELHEDCLSALWANDYVERRSDRCFELLTADERRGDVEPTHEPLRTIYEYGTVPGCHDNGIFALISWFANQDLSWDETKQELHDWFQDTGTWERGGFSESSKEELLEDKKHVWEEAYGWKSKGQAARRVIDNYRRLGPKETDSSGGATASA